MCPIVIDHSPLPSPDTSIHNIPHPFVIEQDRGRSPSRSPRRLRPSFPLPIPRGSFSRSRSRSYSRSPSPIWRRFRPRSFSPANLNIINIPPPTPPPIPIVAPPSPYPFVPPPSWYVAPSSPLGIWRTMPSKEPTDIVTFKYKTEMAYAPATKTHEEAIDTVLELWPELREVERDQIRLLVAGSGELVRVPKVAWSAVLCDIPRYEMMHVEVEQRPPPPQYQDKGKGKMKRGDNNEKGHPKGGLFSSLKRIFFR